MSLTLCQNQNWRQTYYSVFRLHVLHYFLLWVNTLGTVELLRREECLPWETQKAVVHDLRGQARSVIDRTKGHLKRRWRCPDATDGVLLYILQNVWRTTWHTNMDCLCFGSYTWLSRSLDLQLATSQTPRLYLLLRPFKISLNLQHLCVILAEHCEDTVRVHKLSWFWPLSSSSLRPANSEPSATLHCPLSTLSKTISELLSVDLFPV